jgi:hypothetical protein
MGGYIVALLRVFAGRVPDAESHACVVKLAANPSFGGPEQVLKYLARYTHRVAISNALLVSLDGDQVTFRYKDYANDRRGKRMALPASEFIRRFLQHMLPSGFVKARHYGLLANRYREANLRVCRALLLAVTAAALVATARGDGPAAGAPPCARCGGGVWHVVARVPPPTVAEVCQWPLPLFDGNDPAVTGRRTKFASWLIKGTASRPSKPTGNPPGAAQLNQCMRWMLI